MEDQSSGGRKKTSTTQVSLENVGLPLFHHLPGVSPRIELQPKDSTVTFLFYYFFTVTLLIYVPLAQTW